MARYTELLDEIIGGSFYSSEGHILPRLDANHEFLFQTGSPDTEFGVFANDVFKGTVRSAAVGDPNLDAGDVIISLDLEPGRHDIVIENDTTAERFSSYVTVRNYATWLASYAEALEGTGSFRGIDPNIDSTLSAVSLENVDGIHIEDAHGRIVGQGNNLGAITDSYRQVIKRLRQAYRIYGARTQGLRQVVAAFLSIDPIRVPREWRPIWALGTQLAPNNTLQTYSRVFDSTLAGINSASLDFVRASFLDDVAAPGGPFTNPPVAQPLTVTFTGAWTGGNVTVTGVAPGGTVLSETFVAVPGSTVTGAFTFETVTNVTSQGLGGGVGSATVGIATSKFLTLVDTIGNDPVDVALSLHHENAGSTFLFAWRSASLANPATVVTIPASGQYELPGPGVSPSWASIAEDPGGGGFDLTDGFGNRGFNQLYLELDDRGVLQVDLSTNLGAAGVADIVTDINAAAVADPRYGAGIASLFAGTGLAGDVVRIHGENYVASNGSDSKVTVHQGGFDANVPIMGLPRHRATLGVHSAGATTITFAGTSTLPDTPGFSVRIGRGQSNAGFASGTITAGGPIVTVTASTSGTFVIGRDEQSWIKIYDAVTSTDDGVYRITEVVSDTVVRIQAGGVLAGGACSVGLWYRGEVHEVLTISPTTLTIAAPGLAYDVAAGFIDLDGEMPLIAPGKDGDGSLVVDVDLDLAPTSPQTDTVTLKGQDTPDGWLIRNGTPDGITPGYFDLTKLVVTRGASDIEFEAVIPGVAPIYRGFLLRADFWVQQHNTDADQDFRIDASWDGTSFVTLATVGVSGTTMDATPDHSQLDPTLVQATVTVPFNASTLVLRLVHVGVGVGERISIERINVHVNTHHALFLGDNTIVRDSRQSDFRELLYLWSPDNLDDTAAPTALQAAIRRGIKTSLGVPESPATTPVTPGHIDLIANAHGIWERFDLSEYDISDDPVNIRASYDDLTWNVATLTNMQIDPGIPARFTEVVPTRTSQIVGEVLTPDTFGIATLSNVSTHRGTYPQLPNGTARLYENGIPVPDRPDVTAVQPWVFSAADEIDIDASFYTPGATYTIDFDVLIQAEGGVLDLGGDRTDYLWLTTAPMLLRTENTVVARERTQQVVFAADFVAQLDTASDQDRTVATLTRDTGTSQTVVPEAQWNYESGRSISIDPNAFDADSVFTLTYQSQDNIFERAPDFTIEVRSATSPGFVATATYEEVEINQPIDSALQYHQFRVTFSGVVDTGDVRIAALGVRGINVFGTTPNAPGIVLP